MRGDERVRLRVVLLGEFEVRCGDTVVDVSGARLRGLLTRLALAGGRSVEADVLVDALWGRELPTDPANALQSLVSRLRRLLDGGGGGIVLRSESGYRLGVAPDDVDVLRFERLAARGRDRLRAGDPGAAAEALGEAVALYGEPSVIAAVAPAVATRLERAAREAGADLAEAELALGRADDAVALLTALLAAHPMDERPAALQMDALAAQGRQADALAVYERVRESLAEHLGADPGTALRERHLRLLRTRMPRDASEAADAADAAHPSEALDASRSGPAVAPGPAPAPAPATGGGSGGSSGGGDLPAALTSFVGREDDLARVDALFRAGRLVTVVGPGGAGKTRLAVEAGRRHVYRDGTWLVDLAAVTEPAKVGAAVLTAIGLRGAALFEAPGGRLRAGTDELDVLVDRLGGRESLLLVDNCEHLVDAVARLLAALLPRCPGLRVLATSREPLAIDGEALVPLGPLPLPDAEDGLDGVRRSASVRLFAERAAAVRPGFAVDENTRDDVVRLVRGLDGMPLALELAAARLRTLSPAELAAGLSDRFRLLATGSRAAPPRHRTLRAVIAWSWDLLDEAERTVAERVCVLPGGVTAESAAALCAGTPVVADDVPELLAALTDKSLLHRASGTGRHRMLETLREYGTERLAERGALGAVRDLAARYLAGLVAREEPLLRGRGQLDALRVLRGEYDNALAALRHLCDSGDSAAAVALAMDLSWYWHILGRHADAAYWQERALSLPVTGRTATDAGARDAGTPDAGGPDAGGPDRAVAEAVLLLNRINARSPLGAEALAGHETALRDLADRLLAQPSLPGFAGVLAAITLHFLRRHEASLALVRRLADGPDVWLSGLAHMFRASFAENGGDLDQVRVDVAAALDAFGRVGDRWGLAATLPMRALLRQYDGDLDGALADLSEARAQAADFGSLSLADEVFLDVRWIDLQARRGETDRARVLLDALHERVTRAASAELAVVVAALEAGLWLRLGDTERAAARLDAAEGEAGVGVPAGGRHGRALAGAVRARLCLRRGDAEGAGAALGRAYAAAVSSRDLPVLATVAVTGAEWAVARGAYREAAVRLGAAARLRGVEDRSDPQVLAVTARARAALGEDAFAMAYGEGRGLDGAEAVRRADPAGSG